MKSSRIFAVALGALTALLTPSASALGEPAHLDQVEPFRMQVAPTGSPQHITITGTNFEDMAHVNRDQYMHWQIHRDDGSWQACAQFNIAAAAGICHGTSWVPGRTTLEIGGAYTMREGFVELRVFHGLANADETDPGAASTEWSNIVRVPVVVPGPAPTINSLSRTSFPTDGAPSGYQFIIDAGGLVGTPVVLFDGGRVIWPERIYDGHIIQVSIPEALRRSTAGTTWVAIRTDKGGPSSSRTITFVEPPRIMVAAPPRLSRVPATAGGAPTSSTAAINPGSAGTVIASAIPSGACIQGFVWREATAADHVCVTPDTRTRMARQNQEASLHRLPNDPNTCMQGFVWREAVGGDIVCVTPGERAQAADDNRQAASRVAH